MRHSDTNYAERANGMHKSTRNAIVHTGKGSLHSQKVKGIRYARGRKLGKWEGVNVVYLNGTINEWGLA